LNHRIGKLGAFTLIEVLVVVVIIGIAGAIVVPQLLAPSSLGTQAAGRAVIADIIYAQSDAVAHQKARKVIFDAATDSYRLTDDADTNLVANWIGGAQYVVSFSNDSRFQGVTLDNINFGGTSTLEFDDLGSPISGGNLEVVGDTSRYLISVAALTGRVTIQPQ